MKFFASRPLGILFLFVVFFCCHPMAAVSHLVGPFAEGGQELFSSPKLLHLKITLPSEAIDSLRRNPRTNVLALIQEGTQNYSNVLVHLKGTSTFRSIDNKPSWTFSFQNSPFHGLTRIHLNNSVEDPTFLNEFLGSETFRAAGLPAARTTHATVDLNGRSLGLYVLKEGYSKKAAGELYEPGPGHDIDEPLRLVFGDETKRPSLLALAKAAAEPDLSRRWQAFNNILNADQFVSFMALEVLLNHRDGYCLGRNNFKLYHDPDTSRFMFLPHGMDQLFGKVDATLLPRMSGLGVVRFLEIPEGKALYKLRLQQLATNVFQVAEMTGKIESRAGLLRAAMGRGERQAFQEEVSSLKSRIAARHENVLQQISSWSEEYLHFIQSKAQLTNWVPTRLGQKGRLAQSKDGQGVVLLRIQAEPGTVAAWRTRVYLPRGHYRFSGLAKTAEVKALPGARDSGARLRIPGAKPDRTASLTGTQTWKPIELQVDVVESERLVELLCELSADQGEASFRLDSLFLQQTP